MDQKKTQRPWDIPQEGNAQVKSPSRQQDQDYQRTIDDVVTSLKTLFPHGHDDFIPMLIDEVQTHSEKSYDYAAGGAPLGNFKRVSAIMALYPDLKLSDPRVVAFMYMVKHIDAVLWGLNTGIPKTVEGLPGRLADISVYAKLMAILERERHNSVQGTEP